MNYHFKIAMNHSFNIVLINNVNQSLSVKSYGQTQSHMNALSRFAPAF